MATKYQCPECKYWTPLYPAWQTAMAVLRKHRKGHSTEAFTKLFAFPEMPTIK